MKILHVSDTHGVFGNPIQDNVDVVVHSGDFLPNRTRGLQGVEEAFQASWIRDHADVLREWLGGRKLLVVSGNHDFVDVAKIMRDYIGVDATCLDMNFVDIDSVGFYGFPWVPTFSGEWNFETSEEHIARQLSDFTYIAENGGVDVLVSHGPMWGVLDSNRFGDRCGSTALRDCMAKVRHRPRALLHGHIHEARGITEWKRTTVSNAAMRRHLVEIQT